MCRNKKHDRAQIHIIRRMSARRSGNERTDKPDRRKTERKAETQNDDFSKPAVFVVRVMAFRALAHFTLPTYLLTYYYSCFPCSFSVLWLLCHTFLFASMAFFLFLSFFFSVCMARFPSLFMLMRWTSMVQFERWEGNSGGGEGGEGGCLVSTIRKLLQGHGSED